MEEKVMWLKAAVVEIVNADFKVYFNQQQKPFLTIYQMQNSIHILQ
jgi:hypothetical protein